MTVSFERNRPLNHIKCNNNSAHAHSQCVFSFCATGLLILSKTNSDNTEIDTSQNILVGNERRVRSIRGHVRQFAVINVIPFDTMANYIRF